LYVVRLYGRGGQGTVTATRLLAKAALFDGKYSSSIARFGAERRGAPVAVYLRISEEPILVKSFPSSWDCIIVTDPKLKRMLDVTVGFKTHGVAVLNTGDSPTDVQFKVPVSKLGILDATAIALSVFGPRAIPITSTAMIAAFARTTGLVSLKSLVKSVEDEWEGRIAQLNVEAMKIAYKETVIIDEEEA
jgi:2-oxoacid:acceptor oxidoreductase gamma subunit (pyruvate/2-ketoisovalerate family)